MAGTGNIQNGHRFTEIQAISKNISAVFAVQLGLFYSFFRESQNNVLEMILI